MSISLRGRSGIGVFIAHPPIMLSVPATPATTVNSATFDFNLGIISDLFRPVTLIPVLIVAAIFGFLGAGGWPGTAGFLRILLAGSLMVVANGVSNAVGSVGDLGEDSMHPTKQDRPVAAGLLSPMNVLSVGVLVWLVAVIISLIFLPVVFTLLYISIIVFAFSYSFFPRMKDRLIWNNAWIAIPRGALGIVAMWSLYGSIHSTELWTVLAIMVPLVFFGNESRNLSDRASDLANGVRNITTVFGDENGRMVTYCGFLIPALIVLTRGLYVANPYLLFLTIPAVLMFWGCDHWSGEKIWLAFYGVFGITAILFALPLVV